MNKRASYPSPFQLIDNWFKGFIDWLITARARVLSIVTLQRKVYKMFSAKLGAFLKALAK